MCHHRVRHWQILSDHLCNRAVAHNARHHQATTPDTRNDAFNKKGKNVRRFATWEGGRRRSLQIYNRSIALSQPFTEYNTIWSFLKWIRARVFTQIQSCRSHALCQMAYFTRWVSGASKLTQLRYAMAWLNSYRRWNGGWGWSYPFKGETMITPNKTYYSSTIWL